MTRFCSSLLKMYVALGVSGNDDKVLFIFIKNIP